MILEERLSSILNRDINGNEGKYEIHSMYFDDIFDSCVKDNDAGISDRYKYRIRYYNDNTGYIRLEKKEKLAGRCHKKSCSLTTSQFEDLLLGDFSKVLWSTDNRVLQEFCVDGLNRGFSPKAIIDYERLAFVEPLSNVRITIDRNISVSDELDSFLSGEYLKVPIQEKNKHVLEVKFDYILPSYIRHAISNECLVQTSFSKYYLGRKQLDRVRR